MIEHHIEKLAGAARKEALDNRKQGPLPPFLAPVYKDLPEDKKANYRIVARTRYNRIIDAWAERCKTQKIKATSALGKTDPLFSILRADLEMVAHIEDRLRTGRRILGDWLSAAEVNYMLSEAGLKGSVHMWIVKAKFPPSPKSIGLVEYWPYDVVEKFLRENQVVKQGKIAAKHGTLKRT